ncbi:hypothetical protein [Nostoc sp. NMS9]|nr:hypothetical protein [Nostoc sp. NMS9]
MKPPCLRVCKITSKPLEVGLAFTAVTGTISEVGIVCGAGDCTSS